LSAPACQLYLVAPDRLPHDFTARLAAVLAAGEIAALRVTPADAAMVARVLPVTRAHDVALILDGAPAMAQAAGCDGAHVRDVDDAEAARRALGDLQLGVFCGQSRDAAMRAGEAGADYVSFGPGTDDTVCDADVIAWWADLMELPVVAEGAIDAGNCGALVRAGADFLAVGDAVWNDPDGPAAAIRVLLAAIADA
jgi:thiamine-phosphate pyrophosphorylase